MSPADFTLAVTLAFRLVCPGATVTVEPWPWEMPKHVSGGRTVAMTIPQGGGRFVVAYDAKYLAAGNRRFWISTAFHEACHAAFDRAPLTKEEVLANEKHAVACERQWQRRIR
jgi:hypothetical protein